MSSSIFQNLKVVELASVLAGPAVGMFFAELGAEVIKFENSKTGGDVTRNWKGPNESPEKTQSAYYHSTNWGKKSILVDLSIPAERQMVLEEIAKADVLISNFKKGSAEKLGMDQLSLKRQNPKLIVANLNGYGEDNPSPAFDIVLQAETGFMYMNGHPGEAPSKMPVALIDLLAAHQMKEAILIGLLNRYRSGKGCFISVSLAESAVASLANQASNWLNAEYIPQPMGSAHPNIAPYGDLFETKDKKAFVLAVGTENNFKELCSILSAEDLLQDERFKVNAARVKHRADLIFILQNLFNDWNQSELFEEMRARKGPFGLIKNMKEVFESKLAQNMILEQMDESGQTAKTVKTAAFNIESWD